MIKGYHRVHLIKRLLLVLRLGKKNRSSSLLKELLH